MKALSLSQVEHVAVLQAVADCQQCITSFLKKFEKYQSLSAGPSSLRDQARKIKWSLCHEEDVVRFRQSLEMRTGSLVLLLNSAHFAHSISSTAQTELLLREQTETLRDLQVSNSAKDNIQVEISRNVKTLLETQQQGKPPSNSVDEPLSDFNIVPFRLAGAPLAPAFVERPDLMHHIEAALLPIVQTQQTVVILQGLGGIGKSQIAREYATKHQDDYSAVFWINAKSESSLNASMVDVASRVGLEFEFEGNSDFDRPKGLSTAAAAVLAWLDTAGNTKWLMIFDNVDNQTDDIDDDIETLPSTAPNKTFDVSLYFPSSAQGTLLLTSRLSYLARQCGGIAIPVDQMTTEEGICVLSKLSSQAQQNRGRLGTFFVRP